MSRSSVPDASKARASGLSLALGALTFLALLPFVHGDVTWYDAGELTAAAGTLGVPHPTGFPLLVLLGHAFQLLPLGPVPFRMALLSAASVGAATGLAHALGVANGARPWPAALGALFFPAVFVVWLHGTLVEVYALNAAGIALIAWLLLRPTPRLGAAALLTGLGLGAHATLPLLAAPMWVVALTRARAWRRLPGLLLLGLAGAAILAYLPLAAGRSPWLNWGDPSTPERLLRHLSASGIRESFAAEMGFSGAATAQALSDWASLAGGRSGLAAIALVAAAAATGRPRGTWIALGLALLCDAAFSALLNPMGQVDLQTGMPGAWVLAAGLALFAGRPRSFPRLAPVAVGVLVLLAAAERPADRSTEELAGAYGRFALNEPSPGGVLITTQDHLASQLLYLQGVEGMRRDQVVLTGQHLPDTALVVDRYARAGLTPPASFLATAPARQLDRVLALVGSEVPRRPVHWELGDGRFDPTLASSLLPVGPVYRFATDPDDARAPRGPVASPTRALLARTRGLGSPAFRSRRVFSDVARFRGVWHWFRDEPGPAGAMFEEAAALDPDNAPALVNLAVARRARGRLGEAIALLERAVALRPGHARARENLERYRGELDRPD